MDEKLPAPMAIKPLWSNEEMKIASLSASQVAKLSTNANDLSVPEECYSKYYCGADDPLPVLERVYKSIHLEEAKLITPVKN